METFFVLTAMSVILWSLGRGSLGRTDALVPAWLAPDERARRVRVLRRGAHFACFVGVVLAVAAVCALL